MAENDLFLLELANNKPLLREQYGVKTLGIFGSYITGKQKETSDVDILVEFERPIGLLKFVTLEQELSELLGKKVDLVMKSALKPRIGERILKEVRYV